MEPKLLISMENVRLFGGQLTDSGFIQAEAASRLGLIQALGLTIRNIHACQFSIPLHHHNEG